MTDRPAWWRFTGIGGLKRFIPDRIMQQAVADKRGWTKWYEPVCEACHPDDEVETKIADIDTRNGALVVTKTNGRYTITVDGIVRHPNLNADSAVGAMAHYLHSAEYSLMKAAK